MTTATTEAPAAPPPPTPVEWVKALPVEDREAVFLELLRELVAYNGTAGRIDIETADDEYIGYFVPAEAERTAAARILPELTPERRAELDRRSRESKGIPVRQVISELKAEAAKLAATPQSSLPERAASPAQASFGGESSPRT